MILTSERNDANNAGALCVLRLAACNDLDYTLLEYKKFNNDQITLDAEVFGDYTTPTGRLPSATTPG